jgi:SAM-dependent methyltransferase
LNPDDQWIAGHRPRLQRSIGGTGRILELGCGTGRDTVHLVPFGPVVAVDRSESGLRECRRNAPQATLVCADLSHQLPFRAGAFSAVVASLCLHYFSWRVSLGLAAEIRRVLTPGGLLIVRVNSTRDANHGAVGHPEIEPNFYNVDGYLKRFFDRQSVLDLFAGWDVQALEERVIMRYEQPKWIWELYLHAA